MMYALSNKGLWVAFINLNLLYKEGGKRANMPKKISLEKKREVLKDYSKYNSASKVGRIHGVAPATVKRIVSEFGEFKATVKGAAESGIMQMISGDEASFDEEHKFGTVHVTHQGLGGLEGFWGSKVPAYQEFADYLFLERLNPRKHRMELDALDYKTLVSVFGTLTDKFLKIAARTKAGEYDGDENHESELLRIYELLKKPGKGHEEQ